MYVESLDTLQGCAKQWRDAIQYALFIHHVRVCCGCVLVVFVFVVGSVPVKNPKRIVRGVSPPHFVKRMRFLSLQSFGNVLQVWLCVFAWPYVVLIIDLFEPPGSYMFMCVRVRRV
jgi:hypothetical protein